MTLQGRNIILQERGASAEDKCKVTRIIPVALVCGLGKEYVSENNRSYLQVMIYSPTTKSMIPSPTKGSMIPSERDLSRDVWIATVFFSSEESLDQAIEDCYSFIRSDFGSEIRITHDKEPE